VRWVSTSNVLMLSMSSSSRSIGERAPHREEIDDAAAHAHFARRDDLRHVLVAGGRELRAQLLHIERRARAQEERVRGDVRRRAKAHERGSRRHDRDVEVAALDAVERGEALRDEIVVRRELIVGQRLPVGQQADAQLRCEPADLVDQALCVMRRGTDDGDRVLFLHQARERERVGRAGEPRIAPTGGKGIALHQNTKRAIISV